MSDQPAVTDLIPHRPPFLFVDEILSFSGEKLSARRTFRSDEDFYRGHYPGSPITPGVLLCEAVFQAAACYMALVVRAAGGSQGEGLPLIVKISEVRFRKPVYPGDTAILHVERRNSMGAFTMLAGSIEVDGKRAVTLEFSVAWKPPGGGTSTNE